MSEPKRHHYLPQFYLENFCRDGLLWVYDRERNEYRQQTPLNTALQNQYYTALTPDGKQTVEIEKFLSVIEGLAKPIITKVDNKNPISLQEKETLAIFISFLKTRVPDYGKAVNEMFEKTMKKINLRMFSSEKQAAAIIKKYEEDTRQKIDLSPKSLIDFVQGERYDLEISKEWRLEMMMSLGSELIRFFLNMDWLFLEAPNRSSFITSDNPFVLVPPKDYNPRGFYGVGMITKGAKKVIPLSSKTCLIMGDYGQKIVSGSISSENARQINLNIAAHCDRFIIGMDRALLERLVKITKIDKWKVESRVRVG